MNRNEDQKDLEPDAAGIPMLSIKRNMLWNSIGSMTYLACQWLTTVFVVRLTTGYDDAGLLSLAMAVVGIFGALANYKMGTYQLSDINHENSLGEYLGFRCLTLGIACISCVIYAVLTCAPTALITIMLFFVFKAVGMYTDVLHATDQQHRRMDYIGKSFIIQGIGTLAAFILVFWLSQSLNLAIIAMTSVALCVLVVFDIPKTKQFERVTLSLSKTKALFFLKTSLPSVIASLAASAILAIPKQYLVAVSGDASLGIYTSVAAPSLIIQMGAMYLYNPLLDIFPRRLSKGDKTGFLKLFARTVFGIIIVSLVLAVILELIGSWVLQLLYGESIAPYVYLLQPIILSTVCMAFLWFFGDVLITLRKFKAYFIGNTLAAVSALALTFPFVNIWDMNGVSFVGIVSCSIGVLILLASILNAVLRGLYAVVPEEKGD